MTTLNIGGIIFQLISFAVYILGFIIALVFYIIARSKNDPKLKKRFDRIAIWCFVGDLTLCLVVGIFSHIIYSYQ